MKNLFNRLLRWHIENKVLVIGIFLSVLQPVNDLLTTGHTTSKVLVASAVGGLIAWAARNMRGQWQTIAGILQLQMGTFLTQLETGNVQWVQVFVQVIVAYLAASSSPMKSRGYEHAEVIKEAKAEGEKRAPTIAPPPPDKV
jgi:hypothetical protein